MEKLQKELVFTNEVVNKKKLQGLMEHTFHNYGVIKSSMICLHNFLSAIEAVC